MGLYYFNLKAGERTTTDREGTDLPDERAARAHAAVIAREIMRNDSYRTLGWRLAVEDAARNPCFELLFAMVAERLDLVSAETRESIARRLNSIAHLDDDTHAVQRLLLELRAALARADRRPYLVAVDGERVEP